MKTRLTIIVFLLFFALAPKPLKGQPCPVFHTQKKCKDKSATGFRMYGQSKSALLEKDSTYIMPIIFYGKKDYIVTVCTEKGYAPVHFRIKDIESGKILYDNLEDDYIESIGFTIDHPQKAIFEVTLLAENIDPENFGEPIACVGINIQWKRALKTGF